MRKVQCDWNEVQKFLDECGRIGLTREKFSLSRKAFDNAVRDGLIVKNLKPFRHSVATKEKLSNIRTKFLQEHPEKHFWRSSDKFKSVPCEFLKNFLREKGISFMEEYSVFDRNYSIDIAFPNSKIAIEVNGNQHYNNDGSLKDYYLERDTYFKGLGWTTIQVPCQKVYSKQFQEDILDFLNGNIDVTIEYKPIEKVFCKRCGKEIGNALKFCKGCTRDIILNYRNVVRVFKIAEANIDISKNGSISSLAKELGITPQVTGRWLRKYAPKYIK